MQTLARRRPFLVFYFLAILQPVILFAYLMLFEPWWQATHGGGSSALAEFQAITSSLQESWPRLFHHGDTILLYLAAYAAFPWALPFLFFPFAPTAAALLVTAWTRGFSASRALLRLLTPILGSISWREGVRLYTFLLVGLGLLFAAGIGLAGALGGSVAREQALRHLGLFDSRTFLVTSIVFLFLNQGGLLEELGWRGFALPLLTRRMGSSLWATLLLGGAWAMWHFPREIPGLLDGSLDVADLAISQAAFVVQCCAMSLVAVAFVNRSGGSVLPAIMVHGSFNQLGAMFASQRQGVRMSFAFEPSLPWLVAALIVWGWAGRDLGWSRRMMAHAGDGGTDPASAWW